VPHAAPGALRRGVEGRGEQQGERRKRGAHGLAVVVRVPGDLRRGERRRLFALRFARYAKWVVYLRRLLEHVSFIGNKVDDVF